MRREKEEEKSTILTSKAPGFKDRLRCKKSLEVSSFLVSENKSFFIGPSSVVSFCV